MILSCCVIRGSLKWVELEGAGIGRWPSKWFDSDTTRNDFSKTFQSLIVLSKMDQPLHRHADDKVIPFVERRKCAAFCRLHHLILLIFSSISSDLR